MPRIAELLDRPWLAWAYTYRPGVTVLVIGHGNGGIHLPVPEPSGISGVPGHMIDGVARHHIPYGVLAIAP